MKKRMAKFSKGGTERQPELTLEGGVLKFDAPETIVPGKKLFRYVSHRWQKVVGKAAGDWLHQFNVYNAQRQMNETRIARLKYKIENGLYRCADQIGFCTLVGFGRVLVNGQGTLELIRRFNFPLDCMIYEWETDTEEGLASLFCQYDNSGNLRTYRDVVKAWIAGHDDFRDYTKDCCSQVSVALSNLACGFLHHGKSSAPREDRPNVLLGEDDAVNFINDLLYYDGAGKKHDGLKKAAIMAAMISAYRRNRDLASEFWMHVRDGDQLRKDSPEYKLREWINKTVLVESQSRQLRGGAKRTRFLAPSREFYARCISAWNAFREGKRTVELRYFPDADLPNAI